MARARRQSIDRRAAGPGRHAFLEGEVRTVQVRIGEAEHRALEQSAKHLGLDLAEHGAESRVVRWSIMRAAAGTRTR